MPKGISDGRRTLASGILTLGSNELRSASRLLMLTAWVAGAVPAVAYTPLLRTIDSSGDVGAGSSIAVVNGRVAVSYADDSNQRLKLWYDNGAGGGTAGDLIANGTEVRVVDNTRQVTSSGSYVGKIYSYNGHIAIAYCDVSAWDLILWIDDGNGGGTADDATANGNEIRVIDSTGILGINIGITHLNGNLAIAYSDSSATQLLKLWYDDGRGGGTAGDGIANGTEIQTLATIDAQEIALTVVSGRLAVAFQDFGPQNLMIWYDDGEGGGTADDATANGSEVRIVSSDAPTGFYNSIIAFNGHVGVSYYHFFDSSWRLWYDDGAGGGTADNGVADGTEIRTVELPGGFGGSGFYPSMTTIHNRLAMAAWGTPPDGMRVWYDDGEGGGTAGDITVNGTELHPIGSTDEAYFFSMAAVGTQLVSSYYDSTTDDLKLCLFEVASDPNAPASLGPTSVVDGSSTTQAAPTLQFTQSDPNGSDTLAYQIQIDDTSNFSSPMVDYTSAGVTQGATSFAVGQAVGGGSYAVGSASQTLAIGNYYWRVRSSDSTATSAWNTANGGSVAFVITAAPTVSTTAVSSITSSTASSGGNVTAAGSAAVTARGICWSTSHNPTTADSLTSDGTGTGIFSSSITGLSPGTLYYVRAYATNSVGTAYGSEVSFTTDAVVPTVTTTAASSITSSTASSGGNVTATGGASVTARGVCWSTNHNPTTTDSNTTNGTGSGSFTSSLTGLSPATLYYVRAYATNSLGTAYGSEVSFTTSPALPTVTTGSATSVTTTTATTGGDVTATGGAAITARGVCWSVAHNPTVADNHTTDGTGAGAFVSNLTNLLPSTRYYIRAYATNSAGTSYGNEIDFVTETPAPDEPAKAELMLDVIAMDENVTVGDTAMFEITVENTGESDAESMVLSVQVPSIAEFESAQLVNESAAHVVAPDVTTNGATVALTFVSLPAGEAATIELALDTIATGTIELTVKVATSDPDVTANAQSDQAILVLSAQIGPPITPNLCGLGMQSALIAGLSALPLLTLSRRRTKARQSRRAR